MSIINCTDRVKIITSVQAPTALESAKHRPTPQSCLTIARAQHKGWAVAGALLTLTEWF